jgi:cytochrome c
VGDPLLGNKIAAAGLTAALLFFGIAQLATWVLPGAREPHGEERGELKLAYPIDIKLGREGGAGSTAAADLGTLLAGASASAGERRAAICKSCHTLEKGGANGTGPNLWGVVGSPVASHEGFKYTAALKGYGGQWSYDRLDAFLANSQKAVPGTAMVQVFPKPEQRADLLAFLAGLSDSPIPFPEPAASAPTESATTAPAADSPGDADEAASGDPG